MAAEPGRGAMVSPLSARETPLPGTARISALINVHRY